MQDGGKFSVECGPPQTRQLRTSCRPPSSPPDWCAPPSTCIYLAPHYKTIQYYHVSKLYLPAQVEPGRIWFPFPIHRWLMRLKTIIPYSEMPDNDDHSMKARNIYLALAQK